MLNSIISLLLKAGLLCSFADLPYGQVCIETSNTWHSQDGLYRNSSVHGADEKQNGVDRPACVIEFF